MLTRFFRFMEKRGGRPGRQSQLRGFRYAFLYSGLDDLGYSNIHYTREHVVSGGNIIRERLD